LPSAGGKPRQKMPDVVLDASAVLALVGSERGADEVRRILESAVMSAVNLAEVLTKLADRGLSETAQRRMRARLGFTVRDFDERSAWISAGLRAATRARGLSAGDRACLGLALHEGLPVLTADASWSTVDVGVEVRVIR
jgi:ribonuclease VapC